ncbi:MAG: sulfotransferase [Acidobacteria bacterium]|nr:sulfotransferase [Acidobacteriota bacterium]
MPPHPDARAARGRLPSFIAVGPQRTATTWLHLRLADHANLPEGVNEPLFFDDHYDKGIDWYLAHFAHADPGRPTGEIAPTYFHSREACARIGQWMPHCRIVCSLRDPVARLYSLYRMMSGYGMTSVSFEETLEREPFMRESSRYAHHLTRWFETFGRDRTLVVLHDDLKRDPQRYLDEVCGFIGLPPIPIAEAERGTPERETPARFPAASRIVWRTANALRSRRLYGVVSTGRALGLRRLFVGGGRDLPPIDPATAARLRDWLLPEMEALERLIGRDLSAWKIGR